MAWKVTAVLTPAVTCDGAWNGATVNQRATLLRELRKIGLMQITTGAETKKWKFREGELTRG